jgi:hypothetical protein
MTRCAAVFSPRRQGIDVYYIRDVEGKRRKKIPINGVFDCDYEAVTFDSTGAPVSSRRIQLGIHRDAIPVTPKRGDQVQVGADEYIISDHEPDSEFGIVLILKRA